MVSEILYYKFRVRSRGLYAERLGILHSDIPNRIFIETETNKNGHSLLQRVPHENVFTNLADRIVKKLTAP